MSKLETIKVSGGEYAKVATRLKLFREENPKGVIRTTPEFLEDGAVVFKALAIRDGSDTSSASATGHSHSAIDAKGVRKEKLFEKLETISVGRALANLGYLASGEVASSEEMADFLKHREEQLKNRIEEAVKKLKSAKNLDALRVIWGNLDGEIKPEVEKIKEELKSKLPESTKTNEGTKVRDKGGVAAGTKG